VQGVINDVALKKNKGKKGRCGCDVSARANAKILGVSTNGAKNGIEIDATFVKIKPCGKPPMKYSP
nr:hypothetical protein [Tanacetum cinerariifolium]